MSTQIILLERVENLGKMGDIVRVRPGYARNYLLPMRKALRATKENMAYFEARRQNLETENAVRRKESEDLATRLDALQVVIIRQASEGGQLYGSVAARDIATEVSALSGIKIEKGMVDLNQSIKTLGLFPVVLRLHPEVRVTITLNIARTAQEADMQTKTGKAARATLDADLEDTENMEDTTSQEDVDQASFVPSGTPES